MKPDVTQRQRHRHLKFVQANWTAISALAYEGFIRCGRGLVVLDDADFIDKPLGQLAKFKSHFLGEGSPMFKECGGKWPGPKEAAWVKEYDPENTALISIVRKDGGQSSYRVDGVPGQSPLLNYHKAQASTN